MSDEVGDMFKRNRERRIITSALEGKDGFKILEVVPEPGVTEQEVLDGLGLIAFGMELEREMEKKRAEGN